MSITIFAFDVKRVKGDNYVLAGLRQNRPGAAAGIMGNKANIRGGTRHVPPRRISCVIFMAGVRLRLDVFLGISIERFFTSGTTKIVLLPPIHGCPLGRFLIHFHAANEIFCHRNSPFRFSLCAPQAAIVCPRSSWALTATMMVLSDISKAPTAGESRMPSGARTPAASGRAMTLYPAAQIRFCCILR